MYEKQEIKGRLPVEGAERPEVVPHQRHGTTRPHGEPFFEYGGVQTTRTVGLAKLDELSDFETARGSNTTSEEVSSRCANDSICSWLCAGSIGYFLTQRVETNGEVCKF